MRGRRPVCIKMRYIFNLKMPVSDNPRVIHLVALGSYDAEEMVSRGIGNH